MAHIANAAARAGRLFAVDMLPNTIYQAISELRQELDRVNYAIRQIEAVQEGKTVRGRPPKHAAKADASDAMPRRRAESG